MHLRASNSSLLRVSSADISLRTPVIVLFSASPTVLAARGSNHLGDAPASDHPTPPAKESAGPEIEGAPWSRLGLDGGALGINATASAELETPGASLRLVGRRCSSGSKTGADSSGCGGSSGSANGEKVEDGLLGTSGGRALGLGEFVADADAVLIRARSASAGVSIVADGAKPRALVGVAAAAVGVGEADARGGGGGGGEAVAGGRLEVKAFSDWLYSRRRETCF